MRVLGCLLFVMAHSLNLNSVSGINLEEQVFCEVKILHKYNSFRALWFHKLTYWAVH
jgi:O-phosphoseryl-tRNA(Cys) synthetase